MIRGAAEPYTPPPSDLEIRQRLAIVALELRALARGELEGQELDDKELLRLVPIVNGASAEVLGILALIADCAPEFVSSRMLFEEDETT